MIYHGEGPLTRSDGVHAGQGRHSGRAADDEHERHKNVGHQAKDHEDDVSKGAIAGLDDLEEGMGVGGASLELNGEGRKEQNLDRGTRGVPEGTRDTVSVAHAGALKEGCGPGPRRDDGGSDETGLDGATGRVEHLGCLEFAVVALQDERHQDHACRRLAWAGRNLARRDSPSAKKAPRPRTMP